MRDLDTFLDALDAKLADLRAMIAETREPAAPAKSEPGGYWSPWSEWRGGPCPVPPGTKVRCETSDGAVTLGDGVSAQCWAWRSLPAPGLSIIRFRYRAPDALGWLPRGDWTPPAELWAEDCPVRLEWLVDDGVNTYSGDTWPSTWRGVTHIRLVAREMGR